jgi:hypothetical protein
VTQVSVGTKLGTGESRTTDLLLGYVVTWMLPFLAGLLIIWLALGLDDFYYPHAWASAHFATIAEAFARHGILGLHGAPIENFDPLTTQPDNYLHWPPLFFYLLSLIAQAFPDSIRAMHLFMAVIAIANAWVMAMIASAFFPRATIVCGCAFLLLPSTLRYGLVLLPVNLGVLGLSVTLLFLLRYLQGADGGRGKPLDLGLSALAFFLTCFASWEPFLALPGLLLAYLLSRRVELLKALLCWAVAGGAAGAMTLIIFALSDPTFFADLWSIFTFRLGLTHYLPLSTRVHAVEGQLEAIRGLNAFSSALHFFEAYVVRIQVFCGSLGIVGIFALVAAIRRRRGASGDLLAVLALPLGTFWLGWAAIMQGHYIIHEYQMILAGPLLALGIACVYSLLEEAILAVQDFWLRDCLAMLTGLALPCALFFTAVSAAAVTVRGDPEAWQLANFGRRIGAEVPAGAMVVTSEMSMVQTYYAKRHIVRGVPDGAFLERRLPAMREICPNCPLYLALRLQSAEKFRGVLAGLQPVFEDDNFIIRKISGVRREAGIAGSGGE